MSFYTSNGKFSGHSPDDRSRDGKPVVRDPKVSHYTSEMPGKDHSASRRTTGPSKQSHSKKEIPAEAHSRRHPDSMESSKLRPGQTAQYSESAKHPAHPYRDTPRDGSGRNFNANLQQENYRGRTPNGYNDCKRVKRKNPVLIIVITVLILVSLGTGIFAVRQAVMRNRENKDLEDLADRIHAAAQLTSAPTINSPETTLTQATVSTTEATVPPTEHPKTVLPQYQELYELNNDLIGWVQIEGTKIDYPVMQSVDDPEKYLHANVQGNHTFAGTPFLDAKNTLDSDQLLVYAHNMKDGSMFRGLLNYQTQNFCKAHPTIKFDTIYDQYEFEVMAVLYERVYYKTEDVFKFYNFLDAKDEKEFNEAVAYYKEHSAYDTGVTAEYGDQLLALVTCAYHVEDGRFVVIGRRNADLKHDR